MSALAVGSSVQLTSGESVIIQEVWYVVSADSGTPSRLVNSRNIVTQASGDSTACVSSISNTDGEWQRIEDVPYQIVTSYPLQGPDEIVSMKNGVNYSTYNGYPDASNFNFEPRIRIEHDGVVKVSPGFIFTDTNARKTFVRLKTDPDAVYVKVS
jgi:hypothetical protein